MKFIVKRLDMESDGSFIVALNESRAISEGIHGAERVMVVKGNKSLIAITNLSDIAIKSHQIGVFEEVAKKLELSEGETVEVFPMPSPISIEYIKKKLDGISLNEKEMFSIIDDVVKNKLSRIELSAFITGCYIRGLKKKETYYLTKAVVDTGDTLQLNRKVIVDKHCLGGIPGNRTTIIVVPIIAAYGLTIPKTSSRSITSPAGTADTMEVLANVNLPITELQSVVEKTNGCIAFGGSVNLAAADDKLIKNTTPAAFGPRRLDALIHTCKEGCSWFNPRSDRHTSWAGNQDQGHEISKEIGKSVQETCQTLFNEGPRHLHKRSATYWKWDWSST
jgi:AMP phosphorylase